LRVAVDADLPVLGVCLGSLLLATALGGADVPGARKELGFAPVEILDAADPLLGVLAPSATVLHRHGEVIGLPPGATQAPGPGHPADRGCGRPGHARE